MIKNSSLPPSGKFTVKTACPICLTMILPPAPRRQTSTALSTRLQRTTKARLLCIVAVQVEALRRVLDVEGCDGRVVRDLLYDKIGLSTAIDIGPVSVEHSARNR